MGEQVRRKESPIKTQLRHMVEDVVNYKNFYNGRLLLYVLLCCLLYRECWENERILIARIRINNKI